MKLLFISRWFPYPPNNGSKIRVFNLIRGLAQNHDLTLLSFVDETGIKPIDNEISSLCSVICTVPWRSYNPASIRARLGYINQTPRSISDTYSPDMVSKIQEVISSNNYDCVIASQTDTARYQQYFHDIPAIFEEVEIGVLYNEYSQARGIRNRLRKGLTWVKHRRYLTSLIGTFNACTVVSKQERALLHNMIPQYPHVKVIPNCLSLADYDIPRVQTDPTTIIFTGSFRYFANYNAMLWFIENAFSKIQHQFPDVKLIITGDHANMPLPSNDNITLTQFVDDIKPLVARSSISIAPIFQGGGTRLKILEALALKTPVVATSKGAEGLDVVHGEHIMIADNADAFAAAVTRLLRDPVLRHKLADNGYKLVQEKYDWSVVMPAFLNLIEEVAAQRAVN